MCQLTVWCFQLYHDQQCEEMPHGKKNFCLENCNYEVEKTVIFNDDSTSFNIGETTMIHVL